MNLIRIIFLTISVLLFFGCKKTEKRDESRTPYLEVAGQYLYVDEIESIIPNDYSREDSISLADDYIRKWVTNALVYEYAEDNLSNQAEIEALVEDYRKSLIVHQYRQKLVKERLKSPSEEDIQHFYEQNKNKFLLTSSIVKGIYIKLPLGAPKLEQLQSWLRAFNQKQMQNIEKYSIQNATDYLYFGEDWHFFNELTKKMPLQISSSAEFIPNNRFIETRDSSYLYLLRITDYRVAGNVEPYEMAKDKIKTILTNQQKTDFIKNFEQKIYDKALKNKNIQYLTKEKKQK
ncbi:MAG: hypothetical protein LBR81_09410 [Prevotellaceae bacterium]|jgi:hypothetical protein|nr:hypothetical protein [Prevotellaceae bacterium]